MNLSLCFRSIGNMSSSLLCVSTMPMAKKPAAAMKATTSAAVPHVVKEPSTKLRSIAMKKPAAAMEATTTTKVQHVMKKPAKKPSAATRNEEHEYVLGTSKSPIITKKPSAATRNEEPRGVFGTEDLVLRKTNPELGGAEFLDMQGCIVVLRDDDDNMTGVTWPAGPAGAHPILCMTYDEALGNDHNDAVMPAASCRTCVLLSYYKFELKSQISHFNSS